MRDALTRAEPRQGSAAGRGERLLWGVERGRVSEKLTWGVFWNDVREEQLKF